ncbi:MAG: FAD-binding oxidoreductase, partial [Bacilli bacterium]|nr:FAD-binding oxidoreductase [Bacilli bacterium]
MNESLWSLYSNEKKYNCLDKDITTDVLVIGGGISGILAARKLKDNNINVVVLEKDKIGMGTTSKTTAFLTYQHETLYQDLPLNKRREYLRLNKEAFKE